MTKQVTYGVDALRDISCGIHALAEPVALTLGPSGRHITIEHMSKLVPVITKDGVTVAKSISVSRPTEELGVRLMKQVAGKISDQVGDGTTTAVVLAKEILLRVLKAVAVGACPVGLRRGMADIGAQATQRLSELAVPCRDDVDIAKIATIAANGDESIGDIFSRAWQAVGKAGMVHVEMGNSISDRLEITLGTEYEQGYLSNQFSTDKENLVTEFNKPLILMYDRAVSDFRELLPAMELAKAEARPLVIMADDVDEDTLDGLIRNHVSGTQEVVVVKPPLFGDTRLDALRDMAILTGGKAILELEGGVLSKIDRSYLGECESVLVDANKTMIKNPSGNRVAVQERIDFLRSEIERGDISSLSPTGQADFTEKLEERIGLLCGAIAVVEVGGASEVEIRARQVLIENARNAVLAATESGVLPGGGKALLLVSQMLHDYHSDDANEELGIYAVKEAMEMPMRQMLANAGLAADAVISKLQNDSDPFFGYDIVKRQYGDLYELGVIDPAKVTMAVFQYGVGIATAVLNSGALVTERFDGELYLGDADEHQGFNASKAGAERIADFRASGYFDT